ncbi:hypothetical protein KRE40_10045 [Elizabethkingia meningoseptica]|uniref:hypothetical protein n=1 Tax=Elizabethkingia meningoseptica TaxID=238 RepID=UPI000332C7E4|nr:hypothetical protein [Elizabethkingia meningoseptica]AQX06397.1 hypothetical protein BBD33_14520 [Elizabethkingia meningoseptica]AQX48444.1 hypothetical protein B5G46_14515 [Elizabethkingia meningoseptica]EOR30897.1 hypothetical protein L100_04137 [Elizabethkingia meningoseptica ATCC 13253 = NBRC 12535]KUY16530.1 hypothetical protein ATB99_08820 [Elizabethkingia meningoseptica]MDE5436985.1 hypothetical protein [Elizabethkingia meningoseptica]
MLKKIIILYLSICIGSFILAAILLYADMGNEKELYGNLFGQYESTIYRGITIMCIAIIPIFMNISQWIRTKPLLRFVSFFLWPVIIYIFETVRSTPQQLKNASITFFSVFACLLLGYIYFQRAVKKEQSAIKTNS